MVPRHTFPQPLSAHVAHAPPLPAHHVAMRLCACQSPWPWKHPGGAGPLQEPTPDARPGPREEEGSAERSWAGSLGPGLPLPQHRPQSATRPWTRRAAPRSSTKWNQPSESVQGAESRVKQPSLDGGGLELPSLDWDGLKVPSLDLGTLEVLVPALAPLPQARTQLCPRPQAQPCLLLTSFWPECHPRGLTWNLPCARRWFPGPSYPLFTSQTQPSGPASGKPSLICLRRSLLHRAPSSSEEGGLSVCLADWSISPARL